MKEEILFTIICKCGTEVEITKEFDGMDDISFTGDVNRGVFIFCENCKNEVYSD